jgi:hypothetical protein
VFGANGFLLMNTGVILALLILLSGIGAVTVLVWWFGSLVRQVRHKHPVGDGPLGRSCVGRLLQRSLGTTRDTGIDAEDGGAA